MTTTCLAYYNEQCDHCDAIAKRADDYVATRLGILR